jgi:methanogenic corrinoid protein MtbC1
LLRYLKAELDTGSSIGELARLGREELMNRARRTAPRQSAVDHTFDRLLQELVSALDPFDRITFERRLNGAVAVVPFEEALDGILLPLQERVGQLWHDGHVNVAVEHYVTKQIQQKIFSAMNQLSLAEFGAKIVIACPPGEEHDIGALAVGYRCRVRGCRVYYLGANVPIPALANFCRQVEPDLTLLSLPLPLPETKAADLIVALAEEISPLTNLALGGRGAVALRDQLHDSRINVLENFGELDVTLDRLTRRTAPRE